MNMNFDDNNERPRDPFRRKADEDEPSRLKPNNVDFAINPSDVLCGRGKLSFNHGASLCSVRVLGDIIALH